jgi:hypothetical protein
MSNRKSISSNNSDDDNTRIYNYMMPTVYRADVRAPPRFLTPCKRLEKRNLQKSIHNISGL